MEISNFSQSSTNVMGLGPSPTTIDAGFDIVRNYAHKIEFNLKNVSVAFANTLRRSFSTLCPTVTFTKESITILENTTPLHNEFLIHRLELVPIYNIGAGGVLQLKTYYDKETHERRWEFLDPAVPKFLLNTNLPETVLIDNVSMNNTKNITTESFIVSSGDTIYPTEDYFRKDSHTGDSILINCIKSDLYSGNNIDNLSLEAYPVPGIGKMHTRNDPTGTVEYQFVIADDSKIDSVWEKKLIYLKKHRIMGGMEPYNDTELAQLKSSYDLLDKHRVFEADSNGHANHFNFKVESIGFLSADVIVYDAAKHLELCIDDIISSTKFKVVDATNNLYGLDRSGFKKFSVKKIDTVNQGATITLKNENHTLGNLIQSKIREKYLVDIHDTTDSAKYLKMATYRMDHPTIEEIEVMLVPKDSISTDIINAILNKYISEKYHSAGLMKIDNNNRVLYFAVYLFIQALEAIKLDIANFLQLYGDISSIEGPSYEMI